MKSKAQDFHPADVFRRVAKTLGSAGQFASTHAKCRPGMHVKMLMESPPPYIPSRHEHFPAALVMQPVAVLELRLQGYLTPPPTFHEPLVHFRAGSITGGTRWHRRAPAYFWVWSYKGSVAFGWDEEEANKPMKLPPIEGPIFNLEHDFA